MSTLPTNPRRWNRPHPEPPRPLFDDPPANRSRTSQLAAKSVRHARQYIEERLIEYAASCGPAGFHAEEAGQALGLRPQTVSARCSELKASGRLIDSGRTRPTSSGRHAIVLVHPRFARDAK